MTETFIHFPGDFLWGAGTSAYQIEGGWDADGKGESIWDHWSHTAGRVKNGDTGDMACDHYHRWAGDVDLMHELNLKSYRFSISWPRVLPFGRGALNQPGLDFYSRLVDRLLEKGIQPNITLFHWDLPQTLQDEGGWLEHSTRNAFAEYAGLMARNLGDRVKFWATLNEPAMATFAGYQGDGFPPGENNHRLALQAAHNILLAHGLGLQALRAERSDIEAGIVLDFWPTYPATDSQADHELAERIWQSRFSWFLDPVLRGAYPPVGWEAAGENVPVIEPGDFDLISQPLDWLGVNFYSRIIASADHPGKRQKRPGAQYTSLDWEVHSQSLYWLLTFLQNNYPVPPLYVSENGAAFADAIGPDGRIHDEVRLDYLKSHFYQAHRAVKEGVDLRGYYVWSLFDNFEWLQGYEPRFGIVYVDYATQQRIPKDSALWYAQVIRQNGFEVQQQEVNDAEGFRDI